MRVSIFPPCDCTSNGVLHLLTVHRFSFPVDTLSLGQCLYKWHVGAPVVIYLNTWRPVDLYHGHGRHALLCGLGCEAVMSVTVPGTSPKELVVRVSKSAERVRQAQARAACRRAVMERQSMRRHKKCVTSLWRIHQELLPCSRVAVPSCLGRSLQG